MYASMLTERLAAQDATVWLVNTGWTGGPVGTGERMDIGHTRAMVRAALSGSLADVGSRIDSTFGVEVPLSCPDVPASFLDPRATWADMDAYDRQAATLAAMFGANFAAYADGVTPDIREAGPIVRDPSLATSIDIDPGAG
jgi:phosphoenolpyruvate carboxykinase (ATP)